MSRSRDDYRDDGRLIDAVFDTSTPKNYAVSRMNKGRLAIGFFVVLVLFVALVGRLAYWQIVKAEELKERATDIQTLDTNISSKRGTIYDANGNILAETVTKYELCVYNAYFYKSDDISSSTKKKNLKDLAKITGKSEEDLKSLLTKSKDSLVLVASGLTREQVEKAEKKWSGIIEVRTKVTRSYPNGAFAAQLLGSVKDTGEGRSGLEQEYNSTLAGSKGRIVYKTDGKGNTISSGDKEYYSAENGCNINTTIDSVIQHYVEDALVKGMERTGASRITCLVMNPKTGDILAMAQLPEFDPNNATVPIGEKALAEYNKLSVADKNEYLNNLWKIEQVTSMYEPGSTFKLVASSAAIELGTANDSSRYYCNGTINVDGLKLHCTGVHGTQDIKEAVGNSCNPALAKVALTMGSQNYYQYIKLYGFMDKTHVDLPNEAGSIVKPRDNLTNVDLATMGYGQGIAVTPIQLLCAVNAMGNDGVLMQPKVVKSITDESGKTVESVDDIAVRQVITKETADKMREIMEYYVSSAGGTKAYVPGFRVGGKTGTANIATGGGYSSSTDTSFVAMAPMDDPVISMLVIVHKPTKMSYGNNTAGPIVKEIMEKSLTYLGVEREYTDSEAAAAAKNQVAVPNVTGMDSAKAIAALKSKGLKYTVMPENKSDKSFVVQDQYPKAGSKTTKGSTVYIYSE